MRNVRKRFARLVWYCCLLGVIALGFVTIVGTGGSDDSDGSGSDTLPVYNFTIDMDLGEGPQAEPQVSIVTDKPGPLRISFSYGEDNYTLEFYGHIDGTLDTTDGAHTISDSTSFQMFDIGEAEFYLGDLSVDVTADFEIPADDPPTAGTLSVASGEETITVAVVDTPGPGVTIHSNFEGGAPVYKTWGEVDDLIGSLAPVWQQKGAFAVQFFKLILEHKEYATDTFSTIDDLQDQGLLVDGEGHTEQCAAFPVDGNPEGVAQQGSNTFTWNDETADGTVGPGDYFTWYFTDCWDDDPSDSIDSLFNGGIVLSGYTKTVDDGTIVRIGYEPNEGPGGVWYDNFEISEIEENDGVYTHDPESAVTINGGFTLVYYAPPI